VNVDDHLDLFYTDFPANPESAVERGAAIGINNRTVCEFSAWCWEWTNKSAGSPNNVA
jgi:hypothetical protein